MWKLSSVIIKINASVILQTSSIKLSLLNAGEIYILIFIVFFQIVIELFVVVVVVVLVFYGPSTHFRSFRARSINLATLTNLATLFLDKPPRQFTSILCPFVRQ